MQPVSPSSSQTVPSNQYLIDQSDDNLPNISSGPTGKEPSLIGRITHFLANFFSNAAKKVSAVFNQIFHLKIFSPKNSCENNYVKANLERAVKKIEEKISKNISYVDDKGNPLFDDCEKFLKELHGLMSPFNSSDLNPEGFEVVFSKFSQAVITHGLSREIDLQNLKSELTKIQELYKVINTDTTWEYIHLLLNSQLTTSIDKTKDPNSAPALESITSELAPEVFKKLEKIVGATRGPLQKIFCDGLVYEYIENILSNYIENDVDNFCHTVAFEVEPLNRNQKLKKDIQEVRNFIIAVQAKYKDNYREFNNDKLNSLMEVSYF